MPAQSDAAVFINNPCLFQLLRVRQEQQPLQGTSKNQNIFNYTFYFVYAY